MAIVILWLFTILYSNGLLESYTEFIMGKSYNARLKAFTKIDIKVNLFPDFFNYSLNKCDSVISISSLIYK